MATDPRFENHVVIHVAEELRSGAICTRRCAYFFAGMRVVVIGPRGQQRRRHASGLGAGAPGRRCRFVLLCCSRVHELGSPASERRKSLPRELESVGIRQLLAGDQHFRPVPWVRAVSSAAGYEISLRKHGRHQKAGGSVVQFQTLLHEKAACGGTDDQRSAGQRTASTCLDRPGTRFRAATSEAPALPADRPQSPARFASHTSNPVASTRVSMNRLVVSVTPRIMTPRPHLQGHPDDCVS